MRQLVFLLLSPLDSQEEKRVRDGHGQPFGSWPWQKCHICFLHLAYVTQTKNYHYDSSCQILTLMQMQVQVQVETHLTNSWPVSRWLLRCGPPSPRALSRVQGVQCRMYRVSTEVQGVQRGTGCLVQSRSCTCV